MSFFNGKATVCRVCASLGASIATYNVTYLFLSLDDFCGE